LRDLDALEVGVEIPCRLNPRLIPSLRDRKPVDPSDPLLPSKVPVERGPRLSILSSRVRTVA